MSRGLVRIALIGVALVPGVGGVPGLTPARADVSVPEMLNSAALGGSALTHVSEPSVTDNGRFVTYVAEDADQVQRAYLVDRTRKTTVVLETDAVSARSVSISGDGSTIALGEFGDAGPQLQVLGRVSGQSKVVLGFDARPLRIDAYTRPFLSADGRFVLFAVTDPAFDADIYKQSALYDRLADSTTLVSLNNQSKRSQWYAYPRGISPNGRYVFFTSDSPNLPDETSASSGFNVFRRDLLEAHTIKVALAASDTLTELSPDGRHTVGLTPGALIIDTVEGGHRRTVTLPAGLTPWCQEFSAHAYMNNAGTRFLIEACQESPYDTGLLWSYDASTKKAVRLAGPHAEVSASTPDLHAGVYTLGYSPPDGYAVDLTAPVLPDTYLALGDSFSSGEGAPYDLNYDTGTDVSGVNMCHRSHAAYGERLADTTGYQIGFHACSGAKIIDFWTGFARNHDGNTTETRRQLSWVNERTKLITLTIGGNDVGFGDVMAYCARRLITKSCRSIFQAQVDADRAFIARAWKKGAAAHQNLPNLFAEIHSTAPHARVLVVGYPRFFPVKPPSSCGTHADGSFTRADMVWMNSEVKALDDTIRTAARRAHFTYVDALGAFNGHEICNGDQDEYMNRAVWVLGQAQQQSFHPNLAGQRALADLVAKQLS